MAPRRKTAADVGRHGAIATNDGRWIVMSHDQQSHQFYGVLALTTGLSHQSRASGF
jgi:hypothetical protein